MFCAVSKMAFVERVLCAFGQMLELALEVVSASGLCLAGGSRGAEWSLVQVGPHRVPRAGSWFGRSSGNEAGCEGHPQHWGGT